MSIVYIAGAMTGMPDFNRPAFAKAAAQIEKNGDTPLNPAMLPVNLRAESYMPICLAMLEAADSIYLLDGWENSEGAKLEHQYAKRQGKRVYIMAKIMAQYKVEKGDSFLRIAQRFDVHYSDLMEANPDMPPRMLTVGDVLNIPEIRDDDIAP